MALNESCCGHPSEQAVQFRAHVLEILGADYLMPRGASGGPPGGGTGSGPGRQGMHVALTFVNELIDRTLDTEQVAR